jgi:hypothetical protein
MQSPRTRYSVLVAGCLTAAVIGCEEPEGAEQTFDQVDTCDLHYFNGYGLRPEIDRLLGRDNPLWSYHCDGDFASGTFAQEQLDGEGICYHASDCRFAFGHQQPVNVGYLYRLTLYSTIQNESYAFTGPITVDGETCVPLGIGVLPFEAGAISETGETVYQYAYDCFQSPGPYHLAAALVGGVAGALAITYVGGTLIAYVYTALGTISVEVGYGGALLTTVYVSGQKIVIDALSTGQLSMLAMRLGLSNAQVIDLMQRVEVEVVRMIQAGNTNPQLVQSLQWLRENLARWISGT